MNLRQIEVFHAVMQAGSVVGAARLLGVSQPAVSRLIRHTEDRIGVRLFERRGGRLTPTPEAEALRREADDALRQVRRVADLAAGLQGGGGGLRVAANPSFGSVVLPRAMERFRRRHPWVEIDINTTGHLGVVDRVVLQQADIALTHYPTDHPAIVQTPLAEMAMLLATPPGSRLARLAFVPLAQLAEETLISYEPGTMLGMRVRSLFDAAGLSPKIGAVVRYSMIACFFVEAGLGSAVVDPFVVMDPQRWKLAVRPLAGAPRHTVWLLQNAMRPASHLALEFSKAVGAVLGG